MFSNQCRGFLATSDVKKEVSQSRCLLKAASTAHIGHLSFLNKALRISALFRLLNNQGCPGGKESTPDALTSLLGFPPSALGFIPPRDKVQAMQNNQFKIFVGPGLSDSDHA